jgi:recombinational DNA repair protein (RecF pathway)
VAIEKYTTKCIILDEYDQGEHDRVFKVFTREFGLLFVHAKSIRKLESKLRIHMLPRSVAVVTLVKGKEVWRLVGAEKQYANYKHGVEVVTLLSRFIRGEGAHPQLYDRLSDFLETSTMFEDRISNLLLYYIIFLDLGYADTKIFGITSMKEYATWSIQDLFTKTILAQDQLRKHIHLVLKEIQL